MYKLIADKLYRTFVPTNRQIETLMTKMAEEADVMCGYPICNSEIGEQIKKVQTSIYNVSKETGNWIPNRQTLLVLGYNSMSDKGMLNRYALRVKRRVTYYLTHELI